MPLLIKTHRTSPTLIHAWIGVLASVSLLAAGLWTVWRSGAPRPDASILLLDFMGVFVIAFGLMFAMFALLVVVPRARRRRGR